MGVEVSQHSPGVSVIFPVVKPFMTYEKTQLFQEIGFRCEG